MRALLLFLAGIAIVYLWQKRLPRQPDRVSDSWLKDHARAEGLDLAPDPPQVLRLVHSEGASVPGVYTKPVGN